MGYLMTVSERTCFKDLNTEKIHILKYVWILRHFAPFCFALFNSDTTVSFHFQANYSLWSLIVRGVAVVKKDRC